MTTTQFAQASYQEVIDLNTESDTVSVIGLHTPCSATPVDMLQGFWTQFKKVRYDGCSFALVPAARLPVDPLGVSYEGGESTTDPRDLLNPILFHGCHGNDMGAILNTLYHGPSGYPAQAGDNLGAVEFNGGVSDSTEQTLLNSDADMMEALYYKAMTDNTWKKAHPMAGMKKSGLRPMVHDVAVNVPLGVFKHEAQKYTAGAGTSVSGLYGPEHPAGSGADTEVNTEGSVDDLIRSGAGGVPVAEGSMTSLANADFGVRGFPTLGLNASGSAGNLSWTGVLGSSTDGIQFMTNRLRTLGWLDTTSPLANYYGSGGAATGNYTDALGRLGNAISNVMSEQLNVCTIPKIFMGMIMLPPAYKTEQYYRLVINHRFSFKGFRGISMRGAHDETRKAYGYVNNMRNIA